MVNESTSDPVETEAPEATESQAQEVERSGFDLGKALRSPRTWISFGLALAIILFIFRSFDIDLRATLQYMQSADPVFMLCGFLVFYCTFPLRALRWRLLLKNASVPIDEGRKTWASFSALLEYIMLSWFANCIVPAKLGDAYRGYLLKRNGKVSFSSTFGTIFAERLLDMLGLFTLLVISGWSVFGTHLPPSTNIIFISGLILAVLIIAGLMGMKWLGPLIRQFLPNKLLRVYSSFEESALRSFQPKVLPRLVLLTGGVWLLEGFRLFFVIEALHMHGLTLPLGVIIFVALASSLLTAIPFTPAGLGVVEGAVTAVLVIFLPMSTAAQVESSTSLALAVTFLDRIINFWSIVVFGFVLYLFSKRK